MGVMRYLGAFVFILIGYYSLTTTGFGTYSLLFFSFGVIPILELVIPPSATLNEPKSVRAYTMVLYAIVPLYFGLLLYFLLTIGQETNTLTLVGKITAMGMLHGIFGINMAHELGHRKSKLDQFFAQLLLWSSQYTHFFIEHNRGHHKRVATHEDPATARKGETIFNFWKRSIRDSFISAWKLENDVQIRENKAVFRWNNHMVKYMVYQTALIAVIWGTLGIITLLYYLSAALFGILLLETINYIEHYGLLRKKISTSAYERVQDIHSWNSDHLLGRYLLFELTRHSHHHENSLKTYPELQSKEKSLQLPTGYPGMMLLSLIPPLFFKVMDKRLV
jgi:alkane 1-monooxygenase